MELKVPRARLSKVKLPYVMHSVELSKGANGSSAELTCHAVSDPSSSL